MRAARYRYAVLVTVMGFIAMVNSGCAETRVGEMTASQAFHDPVTVGWVTAVENSDYTKADQLLAQGAKVNMVGNDGITPLLWIMGAKRPEVKRLEYMLKAGADPNYIDPQRKISGMYGAAGGDNPDILRLFLKYKGNPNLPAPSIVGESRVLFKAAGQGRMDNIKLLLQHGADINWQESTGGTVAEAAIAVGRFDIAVYCLEHGLNTGLDRLAWLVVNMPLPEDGNQQMWRDKAIAILKAHGADFENKTQRAILDVNAGQSNIR